MSNKSTYCSQQHYIKIFAKDIVVGLSMFLKINLPQQFIRDFHEKIGSREKQARKLRVVTTVKGVWLDGVAFSRLDGLLWGWIFDIYKNGVAHLGYFGGEKILASGDLKWEGSWLKELSYY